MNSNNKRFSKKKNNREFLKTKTSEIVDYFPRDNNDEDFGFNLASMETKNSLFSSKNELLKKKRKQESSKAKLKIKAADDELDNLDFKLENSEEGKSGSRALLPNFKVGDLVLLTICEIRQTYMIANYTRNKKAMIHVNYSGFDSKQENFSFAKYFRIGQFVCAAVISPGNDIQLPQGYMNKKILVSIDPKIVNAGITKETLCEGMDLWGKLAFDHSAKCYMADFGFTDAEEELYKFNKKLASDIDEIKEDSYDENSQDQMEIDQAKEAQDDSEGLELEESEDNNDGSESDNEAEEPQEAEEGEEMGYEANEDNDSNDYDGEAFEEASEEKQVVKKGKKIKIKNVKVNIIDLDEASEYFDPEIIKNKILDSYYFFKIIKIETSKAGIILHVSLNQNKHKFGIKKLEFSQIRPGFMFKANQTRELLNGVEVAFAGNIGSIFTDHLKQSKKNKNFHVRVIHVSVAKKNVSLSALTHVTNLYTDNVLEKFKMIGKTYKDAIIQQEVFGGSYLVKLDDNQTGFIHKKNVLEAINEPEKKEEKQQPQDEKDKTNKKKNKKNSEQENPTDANASATAGSKLPLVMVKEFNYFDDHAILTSVSLNNSEANKDANFEEIIKEQYLTWNNLSIGKIVKGKIKEVHSDHIIVAINDYMSGKIYKDLLSDFTFNTIPKKFSVGNKILCRIFKFDFETKNLQFTAKESLMDKSTVLYSNLEALKEGEEVPVIYLGNNLFQHSGEVIGKLQNFSVWDKKERFRVGKVYNLNVYKINLNTRKLFFSKEKNVYVPSFSDFDNFLKRNPILLNIVNFLNEDKEEIKLHKNNKKNLSRGMSEQSADANANTSALGLDDIHEGNTYSFEIIPITKIIKLLQSKGIDSNFIDDNLELITQKVLFVKLPHIQFYGFLQVELLSDFYNDQQFKILFQLSKNVSKLLKEIEKDASLRESSPLADFELSPSNRILKKLLVVNFDKEKKILFASGKKSLMDFNKQGLLPKTKEELFDAKDHVFCGYVNSVNDKGVLVQFLGKNKFLIRNKKPATATASGAELNNHNSNSSEAAQINYAANINDFYFSTLTPGQTLLVSSSYDKVKNKPKFSTGLDLYKHKLSNAFALNFYDTEKLAEEAECYMDYYKADFEFCCKHNKTFAQLREIHSEYLTSQQLIEGSFAKLVDDKILINLKDFTHFTGCLRLENSKYYKSQALSAEADPTAIISHYKQTSICRFALLDIDFAREILYLTDNINVKNSEEQKDSSLAKAKAKQNKKLDKDASSNINSAYSNKKALDNTGQSFIVDLITENFILCHLEADAAKQGLLPINLINFNYEKMHLYAKNVNSCINNINKNDISKSLNLSLAVGSKVSCSIRSFDATLSRYILHANKDEIYENIKTILKYQALYYNNYNNNYSSVASSRKNSEHDNNIALTPGKVITCFVNGIKKNFIFVYINKFSVGRIALKDFNGDAEALRKELSDSHSSRKSSSSELNSSLDAKNGHNIGSINSSNLSLSGSNKNLKMKFKILHIDQIGKFNIIDLINIPSKKDPETGLNCQSSSAADNNSDKKLPIAKDSQLSTIEEKTKLSGDVALKGIISKIDFGSKNPLRIDFANSLETRSSKHDKNTKHSDTSIYVPYHNIYNFNEKVNLETQEKINFKDLFTLGQEIQFYCKRAPDNHISVSLIPFSKLNTKIQVEKKYLVRILKAIPGRGLVVSLFDNKEINTHSQEEITKEAFVDISEISDDLHGNPLKLYSPGAIALGRVLYLDSEKSKKYFVSLRDSVTDDFLYDILKNGSTIKFKKHFEHFEKAGDFRNKIFKFGAQQILENNQVLLGYITSSSEKGVFIKLGRDTVARAGLKELSDEKATKPYLLYKKDQLAICRITSIYKRDHQNEAEREYKVNVSLRESVIKYNLTLKMKDLNQNNFYQCYIMNDSDDRFGIGIVGSTFTGVLKKSNKYLRKDAKSLAELQEIFKNKKTLILEITKLDKNIHPAKIRFSNISIDSQAGFDRNLVINQLSEDEKIKNEINEELWKNVKYILEKEQESELSEELKLLEKETNELDFEALIINKQQEHEDDANNEIDVEENEADNSDNEQLSDYDSNNDDQHDNIIVIFYLFIFLYIYLLY